MPVEVPSIAAVEGPTWVTVPDTATAAHASRLAWRADREHDRQYSERHERHLFPTS